MASQIITYPRETFINLGKSQTFELSNEIIQIGKQLLEEIEVHLSKYPPKPHYSKIKENGGHYSKPKYHSSSTHYKKNRYSRSSYNHQPSMNTPLHVIWRNDVNTKIKEDVEKQLKLELNKLNDTNSQSIFQAVVDILKPVNNVQTDTIFINILFDIAVIQQNFCTHYVNLLQYLEKHYKPLSEEIIQTCKQYFKESKQRVNEQKNSEIIDQLKTIKRQQEQEWKRIHDKKKSSESESHQSSESESDDSSSLKIQPSTLPNIQKLKTQFNQKLSEFIYHRFENQSTRSTGRSPIEINLLAKDPFLDSSIQLPKHQENFFITLADAEKKRYIPTETKKTTETSKKESHDFLPENGIKEYKLSPRFILQDVIGNGECFFRAFINSYIYYITDGV